MLTNKKGKLFGKISIIDLIIILFIIAAFAGAYYKFFVIGKKNIVAGHFDTIEYQVEIKNLRQTSLDYIKVGDDLYDNGTIAPIGKVTDIKIKPYENNLLKQDGTIVKTTVPERYTMTLTIKSEGLETDRNYLLNGNTEIKTGSNLEIRTQIFYSNTTVLGIEKLPA